MGVTMMDQEAFSGSEYLYGYAGGQNLPKHPAKSFMEKELLSSN